MRKPFLPAVLLVLAACATSTPVNMEEPRRVVGTENDVRVDAQIFGDRLSNAVRIPLKYDITNQRSQTIAIADLLPEVSYDPDTRIVTVTIGSEVPGFEFLPRLITIPPGEKRTFSAVARVNLLMGRTMPPNARFPNALQVKVNFLGDTSSFEQLIGIPERAVQSTKLADELFPIWVERNEVVFTNSLPMRWTVEPEPDTAAQTRRRRRG